MLVSQKQLCDEMISEKEKLIDELQEDLKQKDDQYVKDLRKQVNLFAICLLYTSPSPRDKRQSRMPSSA